MDANPVDSRYDALTDRALAYIRDHGGSVHEDELVRHVFGSSGSPNIWRPLLRGVLAGESEQVVLINDHWSLIRADTVAGATILRDFVAIDVETTGLKPTQHRTIEIALHRYIDGKPADRFETFVNPGRALPKFIIELTGIRDEDLEYAPLWRCGRPDSGVPR